MAVSSHTSLAGIEKQWKTNKLLWDYFKKQNKTPQVLNLHQQLILPPGPSWLGDYWFCFLHLYDLKHNLLVSTGKLQAFFGCRELLGSQSRVTPPPESLDGFSESSWVIITWSRWSCRPLKRRSSLTPSYKHWQRLLFLSALTREKLTQGHKTEAESRNLKLVCLIAGDF